MSIGNLLREPLLHFLLIGTALFVVFGLVSPGDSDSKRIVVTQAQVDDLVRQYQSLWSRAPTAVELQRLIETQVHNELVYREGRSLGLDRDDAVIKRRVRQKYDLMAEEENSLAAPTDAQLEGYRVAHPAQFMQPAVLSFDQVFFNQATTSPEVLDVARAALVRGADPASQGQSSLLPTHVTDSALDLVARDFGTQLAKEIATVPVGQWVGPLISGYGVHLVRVNARSAAELPPLAQVRASVEREWENDQRNRARETSYARLRADYTVVVEGRPTGGGTK